MNKQQIATSYIQVRKIKPTRFSISGYLPFNNNISIPYESSLERDFLLYFTYISNVEEIVAQPTVIPFKKNNITYFYTPDFFIRFSDNNTPMLIEVKPKLKWQNNWHDWRDKWKAAIRFCRENGYVFHIYDEDRIRHKALQNINKIQKYKRCIYDVEDIASILNQVKLMGTVTINYLLSRFFSGSLYREKGLQIIYHLLANKQLYCNWFTDLNEFTEVWSDHNE